MLIFLLKTKITKYCGKPYDINIFSAKSVLNVIKISKILLNGTLETVGDEFNIIRHNCFLFFWSAVSCSFRLGSVLLYVLLHQ